MNGRRCIMADSRNKGASFERKICKLIKDNLNIDAKRNLDQYQAKGQSDIIIPRWSIECKAYQKGTTYKQSWLEQFKTIRTQLQYTQNEFANLLGITIRMISYYESGQRPISKTVSILTNRIYQDEK